MLRVLGFVLAAAVLGGCAGPEIGPVASDTEIAAVSYRDPGPATLTLFTVVNNENGGGAHTALMINGSQRVIFDPAGSYRADTVPERGDVLYGVSPVVAQSYKSYHARETHHVVIQTLEVTPQQAETALALVRANGAVPAAFCTNSTSSLLRQVPGFDAIQVSFYPLNLMEQFATIPGVRTETLYEDDRDDPRQLQTVVQ